MKCFFVGLLFFTMAHSPSTAGPLDDYRWKNRIVVLDFPADAKRELKEIESQIRSTALDWKDRDIVFLHIGELGKSGKAYAKKLDATERDALRTQLGLSDSPTAPSAILLGKDGGQKSRQRGNFSLRRFYDLIDTMPMRKREMRG